MSSETLTCRCRYCGYQLCYARADIGTDARCPQCHQDFRLPGKLAIVTSIVRRRQKDRLGIGLEIVGFISMFFFFPWGMVAGTILVIVGWRRSNILVCGNCSTRVPHRQLESCPACRGKFGED